MRKELSPKKESKARLKSKFGKLNYSSKLLHEKDSSSHSFSLEARQSPMSRMQSKVPTALPADSPARIPRKSAKKSLKVELPQSAKARAQRIQRAKTYK